jgi:hypothetical protein
MHYLCLAYGSEQDWKALSEDEQDALLAQDEALRRRGAVVAAVDEHVKTVRAPEGIPIATDGAFARSGAPLAGFCILEARDLEEAIDLVAQTPCARAKGAVELRPIIEMNETHVTPE